MKTFKTLLTAISVALAIYLGVIFTIDPEAVSIFEVLFILVSAIILLVVGVVIDVLTKKGGLKK